MILRARLAAGALLGAALLLAAGTASAQRPVGAVGSDWRRANRADDEDRFFNPGRFAFEARFGPYYPRIDDEFDGAATPYATVFNENPQFYFGFEIDWLPFRIPYVGVVGPGVGWGYTWASTKAKLSDQPDVESGQDTSLWIMPLHLSAVLRVDALMRETGIPIVPYGKLGLGWGLWSTGRGEETSQVDGGDPTTGADDVLGRGSSLGLHVALGGMLSLTWLDPRSSGSLRDSTGLSSVYLFGEWMNMALGGGSQMRVGTSTWVLGLAAQR